LEIPEAEARIDETHGQRSRIVGIRVRDGRRWRLESSVPYATVKGSWPSPGSTEAFVTGTHALPDSTIDDVFIRGFAPPSSSNKED